MVSDLVKDSFFAERAGPRGGGRLVVVGNSRMDRDRSDFVDSACCVMRFARAIHFDAGMTGTKTDILAVRDCRSLVDDIAPGVEYDPTKVKQWMEQEAKSLKPWHDCEELWVAGKCLDYELDIEPYTKYCPGMAEKQVRPIHVNPLYQYVFGLGKKKPMPITTGVVMILYLLSIRYLRPWKIQLIGFKDFKQGPGNISHAHDVEMDKKILQGLAEAEYIELCD